MNLPIFPVLPLNPGESMLSWLFTITFALLCLVCFYHAGKEKGADETEVRKGGAIFFVATIVSAIFVWLPLAFVVGLILFYLFKWLIKDVLPNIWAGIRNK
jgi:hypothetical protein